MTIGSRSIGDKSYEQIRSDIVFGRLVPGRKLRLEQLARSYGASVGTLREILSRLSSEGLIRAENQRGFEVAPISAKHLQDVAGLRFLLERHAIELSFAAGDLEWEAAVVGVHHKLSSVEKRMLAGEKSDPELWKRYDREFHQALIGACRSQELMDAFGSAYDHYLRYQMIAVVFRGVIAAEEHQALLQAALLRDAQRATSILREHIMGCVAHTLGLEVLG